MSLIVEGKSSQVVVFLTKGRETTWLKHSRGSAYWLVADDRWLEWGYSKKKKKVTETSMSSFLKDVPQGIENDVNRTCERYGIALSISLILEPHCASCKLQVAHIQRRPQPAKQFVKGRFSNQTAKQGPGHRRISSTSSLRGASGIEPSRHSTYERENKRSRRSLQNGEHCCKTSRRCIPCSVTRNYLGRWMPRGARVRLLTLAL